MDMPVTLQISWEKQNYFHNKDKEISVLSTEQENNNAKTHLFIIEWFGLEGTLKLSLFHLPAMGHLHFH